MSKSQDEEKPPGKGQIAVVDFAMQTGLPTGKISAPQTKEEWDTFITRYTLGEYNNCSFVDENPSSSSRRHSASQDIPGDSSSSPFDGGLHIAPPHINREMLHPDPSFTTPPLNTESDSSGPESSGSRPEISASGAMNQDPDIPNIDDDDLPRASTSTQRITRKPEVKEGESATQHGAMTRENMRQLGQEQQDDRVREREGQKRSVKRSKRRERDYAELASARRRSHSPETSSADDAPAPKAPPRRRAPRRPRSRGSWASRHTTSQNGSLKRGGTAPSLDAALFESGTNDSTSASQVELTYDHGAERARVKEFFEEHGYMPAPRQPPEIARRRLRVIRRLGLDHPDSFYREELDRFTRLAKSFSKCHAAFINIITKDQQLALSEIGPPGVCRPELDLSLCCHTIMTPGTGEQCMVINDCSKDWRFRNSPLVQEGRGPIQFYAGAPLRVGHGSRMTVIGSLCVMDNKPRQWSQDKTALLLDLADCVVSELELIYNQQASVESAKLHQISVDFLRRSLQHRPNERAGQSAGQRGTTGSSTSSTTGKRKEGADHLQSEITVDIYDEACREIRMALDAYAVAVVDLSQFHLFYPAYQNSSTGGGSSTRGGSTTGPARSNITGGASTQAGGGSTLRQGSTMASSTIGGDEGEEAYSKPNNRKRALPTYATTDIMAPSRTPQVLYIPSRRRSDPKTSKYASQAAPGGQESLAVLGYSCGHDGFAFNLTSSPAARKIISDFIASNVKTRRVWYTRDDSEGIAQSITHLMPPGTETSMAMPVFGFDGQVSFAVVACWTDPLYTYPAGALQFIETIAGSLLASVMKERLHQAERAQLNFAAAASHELRTPLHQINAAASLLRSTLHAILQSPTSTPASTPSEGESISSAVVMTAEDRLDALAQLEIIEANGLSLGSILENIIDTLDIGKMASKMEFSNFSSTDPLIPGSANAALHDPISSTETTGAHGKKNKAAIIDFGEVLETVVRDAITLETKSRRISGAKSLDQVEVIVEVLPRNRGGWLINKDMGALSRALSKIIHNAVKFTDKGHVHITVQDISRDVVLPAGYDNSVRLSNVSIDIKDSGRGMSNEFLEREVLKPFAKEDAFTSGSGLGLGLAQRMIELLGGKLAIASTLGKGTIVHVEVPVHLLNQDNESDQDAMPTDESEQEETDAAKAEADAGKSRGAGGSGGNKTAGSDGRMGVELVRRDGIYLAGWTETKDPGVKRVGKSLTRQLKLHFCRVVAEINYASLILIPEAGITDTRLADLCRMARPGVQVIVLRKDRSRQAHGATTGNASSSHDEVIGFTVGPVPLANDPAQEAIVNPVANFLRTIPITYLSRPLRPSVIRQIIQPVEAPPHEPETFVSDVVGGEEARREHAATGSARSTSLHRAASIVSSKATTNSQSVPSVMQGPETSEDEHVVPSHAGSTSGSSFTNRTSLKTTGSGHGQTPPRLLNREESSMTTATMATSKTDFSSATHGTTDTNFTTTSNSTSGAYGDADGETYNISASSAQDSDNSEVQQNLGPPFPVSELESPASLISDLSALPSDSASGGEDNGVVRGKVMGGVQSPTTERALRDLGLDEDRNSRSRTNSRNPLKVLVVEDNAVNRRILTTMLKRTACEFVEAADGVEAVTQFTAFRPDLVLLDITMPRKDGFAAAAEMRAFEAAFDIEMTTPTGGPGDLEKGVAALTLVEKKPDSPNRPTSAKMDRGDGSTTMSTSTRRRARIIAVTAMSAEHQRRRGLVECQIDSWHVKPVSMKELRGIVEAMKREREEEEEIALKDGE
ncbi:hypothetical protein IAR55_001383 [Kwoniella newhampshirensis]|uniref:histidine kinase n=1 Tax=Kwoniella newhampshirensis TaxID=1651941 RepID=A0AAW0Z201_9TREE